MRFGIAKDMVTPDVPGFMGGYASVFGKKYTGIHDDCYVKTAVLNDGRNTVLMIALDLIFHDFELTQRIQEFVEKTYGVPASHIFLNYTHNHAGPAVAGYDPAQTNERYEMFLYDRIISCVRRAFLNMHEGSIHYGNVVGNWNINRRYKKDGVVVGGPNYDGPKDDTLHFFTLCDKKGKIRGILLNYACHPVTLGDTLELSSEYTGRLNEILEGRHYGATSIFYQGAGAHERPLIAANGSKWKKCSFDEVDDMASVMANHINKAIERGNTAPISLELACEQFVIPLDIDPLSKEEHQQRAKGMDRMVATTAKVVLDAYDQTENQVQLHAGILQFNHDVYAGFLCGEVVWEVGQIIASVFENKTFLMLGYGDSTSYIPGDSILKEGGYESMGAVGGFTMKGRYQLGMDKIIKEAFEKAYKNLSSVD